MFYQVSNSNIPYNYNTSFHRNYSWITHLHSNYEMIYVMEGTLQVHIGKHSQCFSSGDCVLILPNQVHRLESLGESYIWICVFAKEYVPEFHKILQDRICQDNKVCLTDCDRQLLLSKLIEQNADHLEKCAILTFICSVFMDTRPECDFTQPSYSGIERMLHQIIFYIENHFQEDITLTEMAQHLGYEAHYISRCFNRLFKKNFKQFINEYRIHYAKQLMTEYGNTKTLAEIAYESGFQSVRNFNRTFRNVMGHSPREESHPLYRRTDAPAASTTTDHKRIL